ncbi:right-handed parallel beta-helix repeat-containing protein [Flavisolibacter sp. BT320]|nr:right-handed parallel beta-helix repeat-containing protein [Flavisolibacter longurius]
MKTFLLSLFALMSSTAFSQTFVTRDIKSFGAKGNGRTNDHEAFQKAAAFFNERGGNGKLIISKGTYIVGKQTFNKNSTAKPVYEGSDVFFLSEVKNVTIEGQGKPVIKFANNLRFGAFDPGNGKAYFKGGNNFFKRNYLAFAGAIFFLSKSNNIKISNIELNGNSDNLLLGGIYGDVGIQAPHTGIYVADTKQLDIQNVHAHHFGLDGIQIVNRTGKDSKPDSIRINNSIFEYNARQGLSWVGGNDLTVTNSKFNHTGKGKFSSAPSAGVDVEAEVGDIRNGKFINCEFINNKGVGFLADNGPSSDVTLDNCTIWGVTTWSIWITRPAFTIMNSRIYGSAVHGHNAANEKDATKFINCHFEDKPYNGKEPFGKFLVESNNARRMLFEKCTFVANKKKLMWLGGKADYSLDEKYRILNSQFTYLGGEPPVDNWIGMFGGVAMKNSTFDIKHANASKYYISGLDNKTNNSLGGNQYISNKAARKF